MCRAAACCFTRPLNRFPSATDSSSRSIKDACCFTVQSYTVPQAECLCSITDGGKCTQSRNL